MMKSHTTWPRGIIKRHGQSENAKASPAGRRQRQVLGYKRSTVGFVTSVSRQHHLHVGIHR